MILVKSKLKNSSIHGIGLFSEELVPKDTLVWEFKEKFDVVLSKKELNSLSDAAKEQFLNYAYISKITGNYILCSDDSRFFNHNDNPNTKCFKPDTASHAEALVCISTREIIPGEELTCDYSDFDDDPSDVIN